MKQAHITKINYLIITHPHRDHIGGLAELVKTFTVGEFIHSPVYFKPDPIYDDWNIYELMKRGGHCNHSSQVKKTWYTPIGDCKIDYLAPCDELLRSQPENINSNGLLLKITAFGHKIIIPGDMETEGWEIINNGDISNTSLLLASHHGNNSGYHLEKVKAMNPAIVVISTGQKTEHDADRKYRDHARNGVYTTREKSVVATVNINDHYMRIT